ncbi:thiamine-phosphate kinase [Uliginosibacterium gangwonense]|uniref:thiamine-phosphate kinase n=1 Tax=Uliginosibacterium gangwonense TaxID=392736 RepID=UPI000381E794|nr:thiamine-phosphate kinase [Uliginosibacterium gangwonense]
MAGEFELIARHFSTPTHHTDLGVGDDAALMRVAPGMQLVVSSDMLVEGTHFLPDANPYLLGWKTAAVNISDLAAMAATPRWITLALALPAADEAWVGTLARGFHACCMEYGVDWVGGDTTRGPRNLCATIFGEVPQGEAVRRDGAQVGDDIWVSGEPGMAALGLAALLEGVGLGAFRDPCLLHLHKPIPRVELGLALRGVAHAMLDVSDGILGDLGHILERSGVGAELDEAALPLAPLLQACGDAARAQRALLAGGDDYELLFTAAPGRAAYIRSEAARLELPIHRLGRITAEHGVRLHQVDGAFRELKPASYDHFAT